MKFIDSRKFSKIKELANNGNEEAKDFLFNFMTMDDDKANEYLASIAVEGTEKDKLNEIIKALIDDENEAIDRYDKAIKFVANSTNDAEVINKLQKIKNDEIQHIEDLKGMIV